MATAASATPYGESQFIVRRDHCLAPSRAGVYPRHTPDTTVGCFSDLEPINGVADDDVFEEAPQATTGHDQWIIVHDFLPRLVGHL